MDWSGMTAASALAVVAGLDRTALLQAMISRPIVVAPLAGWLLGIPLQGLEIGSLLELLWLTRLPVGAAIPPDDTQVALGATTLAAFSWPETAIGSGGVVLLALLVTLPLGKFGQLADHWARERNLRLLTSVEQDLERGDSGRVDRLHLRGLVHFALASLASFLFVVVVGHLFMQQLVPLVGHLLNQADMPARLVFPLVGAAVILGSLNVSRALTLFMASFSMVTLLLWLS